MKSKKSGIGMLIVYVVLIAALVVLNFIDIPFSSDETANELTKNCLIRLIAGLFAVAVCVMFGYKRLLNPFVLSDKRAVLWCVPCLLVALANFPFSALISGMATVEKTNLIWLYALNCLLIGIFEEILFRGIFQRIIADVFKDKSYADLKTVAATSALFGLWHLTNLLGGAGFGATVLQVGYSFLIGAMLSAVLLRTGNLWICILLHALFDFGGYIVSTLGTGPFQDAWFWALTAVCGFFCLVHVLLFLLKDTKSGKEK